ncbi:MAG: flagellar basal body P-ring protein FlgI [Pseudomonadota bacterium]
MTKIRTDSVQVRLVALLFAAVGTTLARRIITLGIAALLALPFVSFANPASSASRIKDIADFEGIRENQLVGYGLVVGLDGTGDSLNNSPFTEQSLRVMLNRLGAGIGDTNFSTDNVAAVMVTANLPPFATAGSRIDITVSAMGDAESLRGGTLLVTQLLGAGGDVYALAQGPIAIAGFVAEGDAASIVQGVPTSGRITNGAIVEREIPFELSSLREVKISLRNPDLTTSRRIAKAINAFIGRGTAEPLDPATVQLRLTQNFNGNIVDLLTDVEQLIVEPDQVARVVIDEASGTIVMGRDVKVSRVAVAQGNLTLLVTETPEASQPAPFSPNGETVVLPRTTIVAEEPSDAKLAIIEDGVTLKDLVDGLNALGIGPRDMITILQAIKSAGALQAEIEVF